MCRYLSCSAKEKLGCRGRAILPVNASADQLRISQPHSHPPDEHATEKDQFFKKLKSASRSIPGSLKTIYDNLAVLYVV